MAIDTGALYYLVDPFVQWENVNGKPIVGGHVEVFEAGTDNKIITYADWDGTRHPFKIPLGSDGRAVILVDPGYRYDAYVYDSFNNLVCSRLNIIPLSDGDITIDGMGQVYHDDTLSGKGTPNSPLTVISGGKVYGGIYPIDVNNELDMISADNVPLGVQAPLYFAQDDDEGLVIALSSVPVPEGTMNESAFGYEDGQITSYNGTAFSAGLNYEAGSYVDIDGNTINVTGLQPAGNYQSAGDYVVHDELSSYATQDWVENQSYMKEYMESAFYPSTSNPSGYLTEHQDISNKLDTTAFSTVSGDFLTAIPSEYITENTLQSGLSSKLDSTAFSTVSGDFLTAVPEGYATEDWVTAQGYLTAHQSLEGYATENWVTSQGYLTEHQSLDGLMSADLLESSGGLITGYNGTAFAGTTISGDFELSAGSGISIEDFPLEQKTVISVTAQGGNTAAEQAVIDNSATWNTVSDKLDTTAFSDVSGTFLTAHQDLSDYQTTAGMTAYQEAGNYLSANALDNLSGNWENVTAKLDTTAFSDVSGTFLTAHQDISNKLDTTAFSDVSGSFLTAVPNTYLQNTDLTIVDNKITEISGVPLSAGDELPESVSAATDYVTANSATINSTVETVSSNSGAWGGEPLPLSSRDGIDLEIVGDTLYIGASALTASIDEKLDATVYATDSGSFLTAHQSLDGYLQNTDLEISDNKITGISGVPLAAGGGGEVPEGVLVESGLEFNAVNEISGYSGSAIAQYGAEKQWLTHDDTIVHVANSAQYALGVNVSAVQTLMGLDETVLFETTAVYGAGVCNLSESLKNFERIAVLPTRGYTGTPNPGGAGPWNYFDTDQIVGGTTEPFQAVCPYIMEYINWKISQYNPNSDCTVLTWNRGFQKNMQDNGFFTADSFTACVGIQKVIGIGRKA